MDSSILNALISLIGSLLGTLGGIVVSQKLINYRLERLEESIKDIGKLSDRVYDVEAENKLQNNTLAQLTDEQKRIISDIRALKGGT